jgi:hypothetical protein
MSARNGASWSGRCEAGLTDEGVQMGKFAGVDWAAEKHDVLVADEAGEEFLPRRMRTTRRGCGRCVARLCG